MQPARKKVLFIITKSNWGGAQRYVLDLATNMPAHDYEVVVAAGGTGEAGSASGKLFAELERAHVRTIHIHQLGRDVDMRADWRSFKAIASIIATEKPDVVHLNSPKAGGLGALAARLHRVPRIVYTAHGWPFWEHTSSISKVARFLFSYLTLILTHRVICISRADARAFQHLPFGRKVTVVQNGINPPSFIDRDTARTELFTPEEIAGHERDAWVVSIGELHPNKNILKALEAIAEYNKARTRRIFYTIIGSGEQREVLEQQSARLGISSQVKFKGFLPEASRYLKAFHVFFLPSQKEGVPYVLLEAQAAGLPIVATKVGGIPEIHHAHMGRLVDPQAIHDMVLQLERANCSLPYTPAPIRDVRAMVRDTLQIY